MSTNGMTHIDIFQNREDQFGFSYASLFAKEPKDFRRILKAKVDAKSQISIIQEFANLSGIEENKFLEGLECIFRDKIELRKEKDVSIGFDFKSPI